MSKTASRHSPQADSTVPPLRAVRVALLANFLWINASEIWRYLVVVRPMVQAAYGGRAGIAPFDLATFALWSVWDMMLITAATGFYWLHFRWSGRGLLPCVMAATLFTLTVFGLLWLAMVNMGLAPARIMFAALPLAWVEQVGAAFIMWWVLGRSAKPQPG